MYVDVLMIIYNLNYNINMNKVSVKINVYRISQNNWITHYSDEV